MSLQQKFEQIVCSSLSALSSDDLKSLALGFWYEDFTPQLIGMTSIKLRRAGYLLDFFMSFNCVSDARQFELMALTREIKKRLPEPKGLSSLHNFDYLAQEWLIAEDVSSAIQPLLKYQTRHYFSAI